MNDALANIGRHEQRKRLVLGVWLLTASAVMLIVMRDQGLAIWWRLWLFIPLWGAMLGFMQARTKT